MAAEVQITADIAELKASVSQAVRLIDGMASKAAQAGKKTSAAFASKEAIKGVKDAFDPFSTGTLARAGAAGVAIYGVVRAVGALDNAVHRLADAEYLTAEQRGQMAFMASTFDNVKEAAGELTAMALTSIGDMLTGGGVSQGGKEKEREIAQKITGDLSKERARAQLELAEAMMSDEEKLAAMVDKRGKMERLASKQTGDERIKTQTELARLSKSILDQEQRVAANRERAAAQEQRVQADAEKRDRFTGDLAGDLAIAKAKARGDDKEVAKLERERRISGDAMRIADELGVDEGTARGIAEELNPEMARNGRRKIQGYSGKQRAKNPFLDHRTFNEFFHPNSFFDRKDLTPRASDSFNAFFHKNDPQGKAAAARLAAQKQGPKDPTDILKAQLEALQKLTSY